MGRCQVPGSRVPTRGQYSEKVTRGKVGRGGGVHCLLEGSYPKYNYRPPILCYHSPLSLSLLVYSPQFLRHQMTAYCYYCCYCSLPQQASFFSYPDTISLKTVIKILVIANSGCFPWTRQAKNYCPHRVGPL